MTSKFHELSDKRSQYLARLFLVDINIKENLKSSLRSESHDIRYFCALPW